MKIFKLSTNLVHLSTLPTPTGRDERHHTMPVKSRRSRAAKKQERGQGQSGFAKRANAPSPDNSVYCISDGNTDASESTTATDSSSGSGKDNQKAASIEGLQRLYSVFLPLHLRLNEDSREKRQKTLKRSVVYTKDSRTTAWRRNAEQRKAADGCSTLDAFVRRKVRSRSSSKQRIFSRHHQRQRSPSPVDSEEGSVEYLGARDVVRSSEDQALARSAEHIAAEDLAAARLSVAQPTADLAPDPAAPIDSDIDQITAQLAAFCFEQLEKSVTSHNELDLNTDASALDDEFRVRLNIEMG